MKRKESRDGRLNRKRWRKRRRGEGIKERGCVPIVEGVE
jgi:hypothetical protein